MAAGMLACGSSKKTAQPAELAGEWSVVTVGGEQVPGGASPYIGLDMDGKRLYGNAGCNRMMGSVDTDAKHPGKIHFREVATTRMMGPYMDMERKVLDALEKAERYEETPEGLSLTDGNGRVLMTLEKRKALDFTVGDLDGEWVITAIYGAEPGPMENIPFLAFDVQEKRVHGNAGCNVINGGFVQEEGKAASLKFPQLLSTMMACPDMDTERQVLDALNKVAAFGLKEDGAVALLDAEGEEVLTLVRRDSVK